MRTSIAIAYAGLTEQPTYSCSIIFPQCWCSCFGCIQSQQKNATVAPFLCGINQVPAPAGALPNIAGRAQTTNAILRFRSANALVHHSRDSTKPAQLLKHLRRAQHASFWDFLKGSLTCPVLWRFSKALNTAAGRTPHLSLGMGHDRSSLATNWPWPQCMPLCPSASQHMRIRKAGCWIHSATCQSTCRSTPAAPNLRAQTGGLRACDFCSHIQQSS